VCSVDEYWARVKQIPLYPDWASDNGDAVICRTYDGQGIVRVTKPEILGTDDKRAAATTFTRLTIDLRARTRRIEHADRESLGIDRFESRHGHDQARGLSCGLAP